MSRYPIRTMTDEVKKIYYSIGEVANLYGVAPSMIRFWMDEFGIEVTRSQRGNRKFTKKDVDLIGRIYDLLKIKRYTIEGAKMQMFGKAVEFEVVGVPQE